MNSVNTSLTQHRVLNVLQAGRAIAAMSVVAFHLSHHMGVERYGGDAVFLEYTRSGSRGVDFFFVLSGFIILFAHLRDVGKPSAWMEYAYRRFVRLFPIYWLYTGGFCFLLLLGMGTDARMPDNFADWVTSLTLVRFTAGVPPLPVAWTLFHELAFYAMFSLLILNLRVGIVAFALWIGVSVALYQFPDEVESRTAFNVYTSAYSLYFLFGMGSFWLYRRGGKGVLELIGGAALVVAADRLSLPYGLSPMVLALGLALLTAGAAKLEVAGRLKVPFVLTFIGNASYTLYLVHESVEGLLLKIAIRTGLYEALGAKAIYFVVFVGTVALGCAAYALVERPMLDAIRDWRKRRKQKRLGGALPQAAASAPMPDVAQPAPRSAAP